MERELKVDSPTSYTHAEQVNIKGVEGELLQVVQNSLGLKPNFAYTTKDVEREVQRVFHTGFFEMVEPEATDTRDGIAVVLKVILLCSRQLCRYAQNGSMHMFEIGSGNV